MHWQHNDRRSNKNNHQHHYNHNHNHQHQYHNLFPYHADKSSSVHYLLRCPNCGHFWSSIFTRRTESFIVLFWHVTSSFVYSTVFPIKHKQSSKTSIYWYTPFISYTYTARCFCLLSTLVIVIFPNIPLKAETCIIFAIKIDFVLQKF